MFYLELSHYEFIRVSGEDRHKFLQGQVSCDLSQLGAQRSLRGALCNLKGRVIADFRLLEHGNDIWLQTEQGMAEVINKVLQKYAVFSKVTLQMEDSAVRCFGLIAGGSAQSDAPRLPAALAELLPALPEDSAAVAGNANTLLMRPHATQNRFEIWVVDDKDAATVEAQLSTLPQATIDQWRSSELLVGEIHVQGAMSEEYTPQLLNYDISGVINFKKGCYTGQEVVARMFYRAQAKKRLFLFQSDSILDKTVVRLTVEGNDYPVLQSAQNTTDEAVLPLLFAIVDIDVAEKMAERATAVTLYSEKDEKLEAQLSLLALPYSSAA